MIIIGRHTFRSGAEAFRFTSAILNRYPLRSRLNADDEAFLRDLVQHHPELIEKLAGREIAHFEVHPFVHGSRCFFLVRDDGTWVHFSFKKPIEACVRAARKSADEVGKDRALISILT